MLSKTISSGLTSLISFIPYSDEFLINYKSDSIRIVYYHMVSNFHHDYYFNNKAIRIDEFKRHIIFLKNRYHIITFKEAKEKIDNNECTKKNLIISFDDGFKENYSIIAPILSDLNIPAAFFFISNCIDNDDLMWRNKLLVISKYLSKKVSLNFKNKYSINNDILVNDSKIILKWSLNSLIMSRKEEFVNSLWNECVPFSLNDFLTENKPYCNSKEIKEMFNSGFEIGSHSESHPVFNKLNYVEFKDEISNSVKVLSKIISTDITLFSYPFGIRATKEFEDNFISEIGGIQTFLGIKNSLK